MYFDKIDLIKWNEIEIDKVTLIKLVQPNWIIERNPFRSCLFIWHTTYAVLLSTYLQKLYLYCNFRPNMKNKEIHLRYLEEYMSYSSAMYGASMYLYSGKCSFKSCFELASKASFCTSCCCCSKCSSQGKIRQKDSSKNSSKIFFCKSCCCCS